MVLDRYRKIIFFLILAIVLVVVAVTINLKKNVTEEEVREEQQKTTELKNIEENSISDKNTKTPPLTSTPGTQLYRNEEFGFEFLYPEGWTLHIISDPFRGVHSRFQIMGASPEEKTPNTLAPSLLINIVTPDFADRAVVNRQRAGAVESEIFVDEVVSKKYEYTSNIPKISIDIPFGEYRMILGAIKGYEDVLNQILSTFKFID